MRKDRKIDKIERVNNNRDCCVRPKVPTDEEVAILTNMREIKKRVKELKKRKSEISFHKGEYLGEKSSLEKELAELKDEWNRLEEKKKRAAHNRMISLGYDKTL